MNSPIRRGDLECPVCCRILTQPVHLQCDNVMCASCCRQWVQISSSLSCPCCHGDHPFSPDSIHTPSRVLLNHLENLILTCTKCGSMVRAGDHSSHLRKGCGEHIHRSPASAAPNEDRVACSVIRRKLSESEDGVTISMSTSGKVLLNYTSTLMHIQITIS